MLVAVAIVAAIALYYALGRSSESDATTAGSAGSAATATATVAPRIPRALLPPTAVSGRVTRKADGNAIAGATIAIQQSDVGVGFGEHDRPPQIASTDAAGAWTAKVAPGGYVVTAAAPGFLPAAQKHLAVAVDQARTGIDFALDAGGTPVRGTVTDVGGGPIGGAHVSAYKDDIREISDEVTPYLALTGSDGRYELSLPDGAFSLVAGHDDYTNVQHGVELAGKPRTVDFALVPGATISGVVVARDTGRPVASAQIQAHVARPGGAGGGQHATADRDGKFTLHGLSSGAIGLTARGDHYASSAPTTVALGIGEQVDGVRVVVEHALSISGHVVDKATKQGVAGARLAAWAMATQASAEGTEPTGDDGAFELVGVQAGSYYLFVLADEKIPEMGKSVEVRDKDVTGVVIELAVGSTLAGRVDPPTAGAAVTLEPVGAIGIGNMFDAFKLAMVHGDTDATGQFAVHHVPDGTFKLVAHTTEGPAGKLVVTVAGADQSGLTIPLERRASIAGHVVDTDGAPVANTKVTAHSVAPDHDATVQVSGMREDTATSGDDGSFKIVGLEAGSYALEAREDDSMMDMLADRDAKRAAPIVLAAGADHTGAVVTLQARTGVLRGAVVNSDGTIAPDAWVTAYREYPNMSSSSFGYLAIRHRCWPTPTAPSRSTTCARARTTWSRKARAAARAASSAAPAPATP
jgi:hypothetical protein